MAKKCKFLGFRLETNAGFPTAALLDGYLRQNKQVKKYKQRNQYHTVEMAGGLLCGRMMTFRPDEPRLLADVASLETVLDNVPEGKGAVVFNYYVLHPKTLNGLYAYYSGSVPLVDFGDRVSQVGKAAVKDKRAAALEGAKKAAAVKRQKDVSKAELDRVAAQHSLLFLPLLRRETMDQVVAKWSEVWAVKYRIATTQVGVSEYGALAPYTQARVEELRLDRSVRPAVYGGKIATFIVGLQRKFGTALKKTTLVGMNDMNRPQSLDLGKMTDCFADLDLAVLHREAASPVADLSTSAVIRAMLTAAAERPDYFDKVKS